FIGRQVSVLVERAVESATDLCKGYSRNYLPVVVRVEKSQINREVIVDVEGWEKGWLSGTVVAGRA
ncbi:MAG: hypothetical protein ACREP8_16335, partial [Candidatus Binatia bacterium]